MSKTKNNTTNDLPKGWEWNSFERVVDNYDGKRVPIKSENRKTEKGTYPYYGASGIIDYVDDYIFEGEYLLVSEDGANLLARTYPIAFIAKGKFWVNNHAHIVQAKKSKSTNEYLKYYFEGRDISEFVTGSAQPKFNQKNLNNFQIPLPPLPEQQRIVQQLDALFLRIDKAIQLTNENLEYSQHLLPAALNEVFGDLEDKCKWVELEELTEIVTKGSSPKWQGVQYSDSGILFITSENVGAYQLLVDSKKYVEEKFNEIEPRSILKKGDILMNIVGASIGRTAVYNLDEVANINQAVCLIRINEKKVNREFALHFFNSPLCISYMFDKQVDNARANLSMGNIKKFLIPIPDLPTQQRIVTYLNQLSHKQQQLQQQYSTQLQQLQALKSSLLDGAFKGQL